MLNLADVHRSDRCSCVKMVFEMKTQREGMKECPLLYIVLKTGFGG